MLTRIPTNFRSGRSTAPPQPPAHHHRRRPRRHWPLKATSVRAHDFRIARFGPGGQSWDRSRFTAPYFGALSQPREGRRISPILRRRALPMRPGRARLPILAKGCEKCAVPRPYDPGRGDRATQAELDVRTDPGGVGFPYPPVVRGRVVELLSVAPTQSV